MVARHRRWRLASQRLAACQFPVAVRALLLDRLDRATDAVSQVLPEALALRANTANQASLALLALLVPQALHPSLHVMYRHRHASLAPTVLPAHQAHLVLQVTLESLATQESLARMPHQAHLAHKDPPAHLVQQAQTDLPVSLALQLLPHQPSTVSPVSQVTQDRLVPKDPQAIMERTANTDPLVPKAPGDLPGLQAPMVPLAQPAQQALRANRAKRACVRNTALWTAAFSSRTARGDKRPLPVHCTCAKNSP